MMELTIAREELLKPLSYVAGVVERRQTLPVLSNVLLCVQGTALELTGTDLEVEIITTAATLAGKDGSMTVPARKLYDICRALPAEAQISITQDGDKVIVRSGKSRFTLLTLPADDFPSVGVEAWDVSFKLRQDALKRLLERTQFCMAHQDVRYYLNGLLLELAGKKLRAVATDGHRMGLSDVELEGDEVGERQVIVPRKGVHEITRFLSGGSESVEIKLSSNHMQVVAAGVTLTSKLVDGRFPDYNQVVPTSYQCVMRIERTGLREALGRVAILANDKYRGARFNFRAEVLVVSAHNPEQEEAEEEIPASYSGEELEIGFNVNYVIDAVNGLEADEIELGVNDPSSSCVLQSSTDGDTRYIVMPMRL
ncbi:MAG: DNA polymerase III subunit beta [Gammaproteobacteria bacterium]|nr:MAG: DNA polymerase III subunit beta [Gammaproteobacteria bacterium]